MTWQSNLLSSANLAAAAITDITEAVRDDVIHQADNVGSGDTLTILVDAVRLLIEGTAASSAASEAALPAARDEATGQLHAVICKWLNEQSGSNVR